MRMDMKWNVDISFIQRELTWTSFELISLQFILLESFCYATLS